jgi:hypothetical protein
MMKKVLVLAVAALLPALSAHAQSNVQIGLLDCVVEAGGGFIVGSTKDVSCVFDPAGNRPAENYYGVVKKFGLDVGRTGKSYIKWGVLAPSADAYAPGALAGNYVGVSAEATVGVGVGANALIGGSNKSFILQPISVQAQEGLNLAVGFTEFELRGVAN